MLKDVISTLMDDNDILSYKRLSFDALISLFNRVKDRKGPSET